jgi:chromosome segregation ATPase
MIGIVSIVRKLLRREWTQGWTWILTGTIALSGCSTTKPPTDTLAKAALSVRAARDARADELAPMDLKRASDKLEKAKQAMAAKRYDDARRLAEGAQVEAELAEAKSETEIVRRAADDVRRRVDALQTEAERESRKPLAAVPNQE